MAWISRNVCLKSPLSLTSWRKVAIGTWRSAGDPSVYGTLDVDVEPLLAFQEKLKKNFDQKITLSHIFGKAIARVIDEHPEINCILRFGRLYPRKSVDVFFQVASDENGKDLSGTTIKNANRKSIIEIAQELQAQANLIRAKGDPSFKQMKKTMNLIPGGLAGCMIKLTGFLMYTLNLWSPLLGIPRDPFGSVMLTNIGSLGLDFAYAPLVPYSRVPLLIALGAVKERPVVKEKQIVIRQVCSLGVTFDHRLIDGVHAAKMLKTLNRILSNPESELA